MIRVSLNQYINPWKSNTCNSILPNLWMIKIRTSNNCLWWKTKCFFSCSLDFQGLAVEIPSHPSSKQKKTTQRPNWECYKYWSRCERILWSWEFKVDPNKAFIKGNHWLIVPLIRPYFLPGGGFRRGGGTLDSYDLIGILFRYWQVSPPRISIFKNQHDITQC